METAKKIDNPKSAEPLAIEPYDKEWGVGVSAITKDPSPFPRINNILRWLKERDFTANAERAVIYTEGYFKKYRDLPQILKCAMSYRDVLENVTINIWPDELIVGEIAAPAKSAPVYPEFAIDWLCDEMINSPLDQRRNDRYVINEETQKALLGIQKYWKGNTLEEHILSSLTEEDRKGSHLEKGVNFFGLFASAGVGHVCANYEKLFTLGFGGIRRQIIEKRAELIASNPSDITKKEFYDAALISLEGAVTYIKRYSKLAYEMAEKEIDDRRKAELLLISSNCAQVAEGVPRDFWEAIQLWHIATNMIIIETNGHSVTYGRFDQLFYPFYKHDMESGTFKREFIQELIEMSFLKMHELCKIRDKTAIVFSSGTIMGGTALDVGGVDKDGNDATNDLSYMVLDAHAHTRIPNPWMGVRLHDRAPREFKIKTFNVIRIGTGEPKVFNDSEMIKALLNYDKPIEEARDYVGIGCVEPCVPGKTYGWHDSSSFNIAKVLQLAINHGRCIDCSPKCMRYNKCAGIGGRLGIDTGGLDTFKSFDDVMESFDKQMKYWCDIMINQVDKVDLAHQKLKPLPYLSLLIDDCIGKGVDVSAGGAKYNHSGPQGVGIGTVSDSLTAIKQLVFDEKKTDGATYLKALKADWKGYEPLYALVNSDKMHCYGNDDDYADDVAKFVTATYCKHVEHRPTAHGGEYMPGVFSVSQNVMAGFYTAATPDGRMAYEPLSDCIGPVHTKVSSHDRSGPTAIAKSVAKLDHSRIGNGIILNWKFSPGAVSGETGRDNLISLMDVYFDCKGMQSQFNIVGKEVMICAQRQPEQYKDLLVRIAGYSAYFVELSEELQSDLISRTELSFD
ncbi:MAG: formate C-acetyltransferase/glycerol dehydratase family glycyl radical enzyme [Deltaproteobacteria bacterium]|nr:formate C-acetyltransferase/glycerol dehydratase family glycyl radical enzyme [Deltaproteobacteria bacterium]